MKNYSDSINNLELAHHETFILVNITKRITNFYNIVNQHDNCLLNSQIKKDSIICKIMN